MSVNFSQLRRRQSSREILYRTQISRSEEAEEGAAGGAAAGGDDGGISFGVAPSSGRSYTIGHGHHAGAAEAARNANQNAAMRNRSRSFRSKLESRQLSISGDKVADPAHQMNPDEMGEIMWEMRPRFATSAGELKRRKKKSMLAERDRKESGEAKGGHSRAPLLEPIIDEDKEDEELEDKVVEAGLSPADALTVPTRNESVSQFSTAPEGYDDGENRESWDSKFTFILATIGYAVGLGNVWRFPYLAQKNGGGAFLIPYWIMLFAEGLPLFLLELAIGQRLRKGSIGVWKQVSPYLGGIGIASGVVSFNVALYYNTIIAWCLNYFVRSFQYPLPWSECPTEIEPVTNVSIVNEECKASSPTQYFWYRNTLDISTDIETPDNFNFVIAACLLVAWCLVYICIIKGITENPKIIYITAIYPYVVLIVFFFRAVTLEGMASGVTHLFKPKWERLADPVVWLEAGTQIFFSLGLAFGGLIAYSSYNPINNNCTRDALIVAFTNCATSMFAGIVIFAIMGFKATQVHKVCLSEQRLELMDLFQVSDNETLAQIDVREDGVATWSKPGGLEVTETNVTFCSIEKELDNSASGTGLAFILFTEAVNQFPGGNFWAVLFFMMLFTLGLDSQFGTLQGVIQCCIDLKIFPKLRKEILTGVICCVCLVLSLAFSHGAGNYIFTLFDNFAGSVPLLVIALFECIAVAYFYGLKRFSDDIELMTGSRPNAYWLFCWKFVSPLAMTGILVASVIDMIVSGAGYEAWDAVKGEKYEREWPAWCQALIGILICASVLWIPIVAILQAFGITLLKPEAPGWFPEDELRAYYGLDDDNKITKLEKYVFGVREDGTEGICFPTRSKDNIIQPPPIIPTISEDPPSTNNVQETKT